MSSLSCWLRLYCLVQLTVEFNGYVLLAADAEDFRNIAKKIVPENLANKLARFASDITVKQNARDKSEESEDYGESEAEDFDGDAKVDSEIALENNVKDSQISGEAMYVKEWNTRIDFDELVERVKDRLTKELTEKLKKDILNPQDGSPSQSIYSNVAQSEIQNDRIKNSAQKDINYGYKYDKKSYNIDKTYGYNNSKNKRLPTEYHKHIKTHITADYQDLKQPMSTLKNTGQDYESLENNKHTRHDEYTQEKYDGKIKTNHKTPYFINSSKEKNYFYKEKTLNEPKHEEDNNLVHSQSNKAPAYSIEEKPKKIQSMNFDKKYIDNNSDSTKYIEKDKFKNEYEESEPVEHNYDKISKQFNTNQNTFVSTDNKQPFYDEFDLLSKQKNDSYEEYVVPQIENKYASEETNTPTNEDHPRKVKPSSFNSNEKSRLKVKYINNNLKNVTPLKSEKHYVHTDENKRLTGDYREVTDKSQEIKAKTESLWYNYDDVEPKTIKDDRFKDMEMISPPPIQKAKAKGTMIPTREYFKMSSPNYYMSLPTVVEKYDSNEPLPERDRERKVIKHFFNPPATINKKVRLN